MWDRSHTHGIKGMLTKTVQNGTVRPTTEARDRELAQPCDDQIFLSDGWWSLMRPSSSHLTTASSSLARSNVPNSPFGFPKLPRPSTRSPGVSSWSVADGSESGGLLARSESGIAPACDRGGWGALRSLGAGLFVLWLISCFLPRSQSSALRHDCSSARWIQHRPRKNGSTGPNCTVLTISLAKPGKRAAGRQRDRQPTQQTWLHLRRTSLPW